MGFGSGTSTMKSNTGNTTSETHKSNTGSDTSGTTHENGDTNEDGRGNVSKWKKSLVERTVT